VLAGAVNCDALEHSNYKTPLSNTRVWGSLSGPRNAVLKAECERSRRGLRE
jgi:hypothetical protein